MSIVTVSQARYSNETETETKGARYESSVVTFHNNNKKNRVFGCIHNSSVVD